MAVTSFIPEVWSRRLMIDLQKNLVYAPLVNRDYEGDIRGQGDTVHVNRIGPVSTFAYTGTLPAPEALDTTQDSLLIDQARAFNFALDDVDRAQVANDGAVMGEARANAAYQLADYFDQHVAARYADVPAGLQLGTDVAPLAAPTSEQEAYDYLVDLSVLMDEGNIPEPGRWVVCPPWFWGLFRKDSRFIDNVDGVIRNGFQGRVAGFDAYKSNNVPNTAGNNWKVLGGRRAAISAADQVVKVEAFRPEASFSDAVKGLHVFGVKTFRPEELALIHIDRT